MILRTARTLLWFAVCPIVVAVGVLVYRLSGSTPAWAYRAFVRWFCVTSGRSNDWMATAVSCVVSRVEPSQGDGLLGSMRGSVLEESLRRLSEDGYLLFPRALSQEVCNRLMQYALQENACLRRMDGESRGPSPKTVRFEPTNVQAVRYDYPVEGLLENEDVQALLADESILALAQAYLRASPCADVLGMWWHTGFKHQPDSEAAQFFHFDLDRIKWLKIFVYLTDVGPAEGPHVFVSGSHRSHVVPTELLSKGYARLSDDEVFAHYSVDSKRTFTGLRGTVIVEDTRGLHKGEAVTGAPRLMLQLQFSNSLFGATYPKARIKRVRSPGLAARMRTSPQVFGAYR